MVLDACSSCCCVHTRDCMHRWLAGSLGPLKCGALRRFGLPRRSTLCTARQSASLHCCCAHSPRCVASNSALIALHCSSLLLLSRPSPLPHCARSSRPLRAVNIHAGTASAKRPANSAPFADLLCSSLVVHRASPCRPRSNSADWSWCRSARSDRQPQQRQQQPEPTRMGAWLSYHLRPLPLRSCRPCFRR